MGDGFGEGDLSTNLSHTTAAEQPIEDKLTLFDPNCTLHGPGLAICIRSLQKRRGQRRKTFQSSPTVVRSHWRRRGSNHGGQNVNNVPENPH